MKVMDNPGSLSFIGEVKFMHYKKRWGKNPYEKSVDRLFIFGQYRKTYNLIMNN